MAVSRCELAAIQRSPMRQLQLAIVLVLQFLFAIDAGGQDLNEEPEYLPVIATSGSVEIEKIRISRERISGQVSHADFTNMVVSLWLTSKEESPERTLLQITELDPIYDGTGKLLTTKQRLDALPFLKKDFRGLEQKLSAGKNGPIIDLLLDAPSREATTIKSIKGKAVVSEVKEVHIDFKDLAAINKKVLEDRMLNDFRIEVEIEVIKGETELTLQVPANHERLMWWGLVTNSRRTVPIFFESRSADGDTLTKKYRGDQTTGTFLGIVMAKPTKTQEMEFHFRNIELP
jgi:hypothetical protein